MSKELLQYYSTAMKASNDEILRELDKLRGEYLAAHPEAQSAYMGGYHVERTAALTDAALAAELEAARADLTAIQRGG